MIEKRHHHTLRLCADVQILDESMSRDLRAVANLIEDQDPADDVKELYDCLKKMRDEYSQLPHSLGYSFTHLPEIDRTLAKFKTQYNL